MNTLTRIFVASAMLLLVAESVSAQGWPTGDSVYYGGDGGVSFGCGDGGPGGFGPGGFGPGGCGPGGFGPGGCGPGGCGPGGCGPYGGGMPPYGAHLRGAMHHLKTAAHTYTHPCAPVGDGYHPGALAHAPIFGQQIANPYGSYPGVGPNGGYSNYGDACCGPSWFCVAIDAVALTRDNDRDLNLTSDGITGPIVLGTSDTDFDYEAALRVTGRIQLSAVTNFEATYLGLLDWNQSARATSDNHGLYSIFSEFGTVPLVGVGFRETDQATTHTLDYNSELESVETHFRRAWTTPKGCVHGSWLLGARWIRVSDDFRHTTDVLPHLNPFYLTGMPPMPTAQGPGNLDYRIATENDLVGMQFGSQIGACILPGLSVSGEAKLGVYANQVDQNTFVDGSPNPTPAINDLQSSTEFAYGTDVRASAIWQLSPLMKVRAGYEALFLSGLATGAGSFSTDLPLTSVSSGDVSGSTQFNLEDDEDLIYHGFHLGLELGW